MFSLTYIHHDCFLLRTPELAVVFDYWKDPLADSAGIPPFLKDLPADIPLYVLVSHFHKDHFNPEIFRWADMRESVRYIVSRDVARKIRYRIEPSSTYKGKRLDDSKITVLSKLEQFSDNLLTVDAFGSTDIGNSYALTIKSDSLTVFHAGDLNCWTWRDESTPEEVASAEKAFLSELHAIAASFDSFDIAMFPVDSRIGTGYEEGARVFLRNFRVKHFFPMHFELAEDAAELSHRHADALAFEKYSSGYGELVGLTATYDCFMDDSGKLASDGCDVVSELKRSWYLSAGDVNAERQLSLPFLISRLIEISTNHANMLGIGNSEMPNNHCGWVLSRVCVEMNDYPAVDSFFSISTWIESWNRHFSERAFSINDNSGHAIGYARQTWMVLDTETHANAGLSALAFDESYLSQRICPIKKQGKHRLIQLPEERQINDRRSVEATAPVRFHTFGYSDLDGYRHVNTVRFVELLMNQFTLEEHDTHYVARIEISFLSEGKYGKVMEILRVDSCDSDDDELISEFMIRTKEEHTPVLYSKVILKPRRGPYPSL